MTTKYILDSHCYLEVTKNYYTKNFLTFPDYNDYNWLENYQNSFFKVDVNTSVKSGMLITST